MRQSRRERRHRPPGLGGETSGARGAEEKRGPLRRKIGDPSAVENAEQLRVNFVSATLSGGHTGRATPPRRHQAHLAYGIV